MESGTSWVIVYLRAPSPPLPTHPTHPMHQPSWETPTPCTHLPHTYTCTDSRPQTTCYFKTLQIISNLPILMFCRFGFLEKNGTSKGETLMSVLCTPYHTDDKCRVHGSYSMQIYYIKIYTLLTFYAAYNIK